LEFQVQIPKAFIFDLEFYDSIAMASRHFALSRFCYSLELGHRFLFLQLLLKVGAHVFYFFVLLPQRGDLIVKLVLFFKPLDFLYPRFNRHSF
jgi:hypothetical protein